jgi:hypothetical protein
MRLQQKYGKPREEAIPKPKVADFKEKSEGDEEMEGDEDEEDGDSNY